MWPMRKRRPIRKSKLSGAIKSFVESPVAGIWPHVKEKGSVPPGWSWPWRISSRSSPERGLDWTLQLFEVPGNVGLHPFQPGFAAAKLSAVTPKVMSFVRTMPLLLFAIWPSSISTYSSRIPL